MSAPGLHTEARKALPGKAWSMPRILLRTPEDPEEPAFHVGGPTEPQVLLPSALRFFQLF